MTVVSAITPDELRSRVLYEDKQILIIDKPAGLAVHAGPSGASSLESYLEHLKFGYKETPQPAHRLDADTTGCLALGRNARGLKRLTRAFAAGRVKKVYWAVTAGWPPTEDGLVDAPLEKVSSKAKGWRMVVSPSGKAARTHFRYLGRGEGLSWLELTPETGRTHQIRVHCAHMGAPILGDTLYGGTKARVKGMDGPCLHLIARTLTLPLYDDQLPIVVNAPMPDHLRPAFEACGYED